MYISSVIYISWYWSRLGCIHSGLDAFVTWTTFTGLFTQRPAQLRMKFEEGKKNKMFNQLLEREYSETDVVIYIQNGVFAKARMWNEIIIRHTRCAEWLAVNCRFSFFKELRYGRPCSQHFVNTHSTGPVQRSCGFIVCSSRHHGFASMPLVKSESLYSLFISRFLHCEIIKVIP